MRERQPRNGHRERKLVTSVGTINLRTPMLRTGSHFPEDFIERYSIMDRAVIAAMPEMAADGVSTRKVKRIAQTMGMDRMSASQVSRICSSLDESFADLQERDLSNVIYPYILLDATYNKCRDEGRVQSTALVAPICAGSGGSRRPLRLDAIDTKSYDSWKSFLLLLRARGVDGVTCVTSDSHGGLKRAIREAIPGAAWQRCIVHLMRSTAGNAPTRRNKGAVLGILKAVFDEHDAELVRKLHRLAAARIEGFCPKAAEVPEEAEADALAYLDLPLRAPRQAAHQQRAGARQPRAQEPQPRRTGLPQQEVAHQDDGRRVLGDGRGLGGPPLVRR